MILVGPESSGDESEIRMIHDQAFGQKQEGRLVDVLRAAAQISVSLVAKVHDRIVGHILFSPVTIRPSTLFNRQSESSLGFASFVPPTAGLGLAPLAVLPDFQRQGIGSRLVRQGLEECSRAGAAYVVVLGSPRYYARFGFVPAADWGLSCDFPAPPGAFMAMELRPGFLTGTDGRVHYLSAFDEFAAVDSD